MWDVRTSACIGKFVQKKLDGDTWPTIRFYGPSFSPFSNNNRSRNPNKNSANANHPVNAEAIAVRLALGQLQFFNLFAAESAAAAFSQPPAWKINERNIATYAMSRVVATKTSNKNTATTTATTTATATASVSYQFHVATFVPEQRGAPGKVKIFRSSNPAKPVVQSGLFNAQHAKLSFSPSGELF